MAQPHGPSYFHKIYDLTISSPIPLPELESVTEISNPDIRIQFSAISPVPPEHADVEKLVLVGGDGPRFYWKGIATYFVEGGSLIHIDPAVGAQEIVYRIPLLRVVLGSILKYHGLFALHASAVEIDGRVSAFVGEKGMGKSTLTAALAARGHRVLSDDVVAIAIAALGTPDVMVVPGLSQIKLTEESLTAIGNSHLSISDAPEDRGKYTYNPGSGSTAGTGAQPLGRIYSIRNAADITVSSMSEQEALSELLIHEYSSRILSAEPLPAEQMMTAIRLSKRNFMTHLFRPAGLHRLPDLVATIEKLAGEAGDTV